LIRQTESQAPATARNLIARARVEIEDEALRKDLIELIERVIIYKLSRLSREEIQAMLQIHDIRESRVYQEAKEEGRKEVVAILRLAAEKKSDAAIAAILQVDVELVRQVLAQVDEHS